MRSTKVILEEIDEAEIEFGREALEAKNIFQHAKADDRELTAVENRRFETAASAAKQTKQRLEQLRVELGERQRQEQGLKNSGIRKQEMATSNYGHWQPNDSRVLPTNGVMPGEEQQSYPQHVGVARMQAFKDARAALDSGKWMQAFVARHFRDSRDPAAEKYCEQRGIQITNSAYEGSGSAGGYLVPPQMSAAIIEVRERVGVMRQVLKVMPAASDVLSVPKKSGGLTVYYPGELGTMTASDKGWGSVGLTVEKRAVLSKISQELSDDSLISIVDNIVSEQAYALALQEDNEGINGTGISTYGHVRGLINSIGSAGVSTAASGHDTWAELDLADMAAAMGKLPDRFHVYEPVWICSFSFWTQVMLRLAFSAGGALMSEVVNGIPGAKSFLGHRVFTTAHMPIATAVATKCALFGAFTQAGILADRGGVRMSRSDDWKFDEDLIAIKTTSRYDMNIHEPGDGSNAGAYVALATAS